MATDDRRKEDSALVVEIRELRKDVRKSVKYLAKQRLRNLGVFIAAVFVAITFHDTHLEHCGPGSRPDTRFEQRICNTLFPFHNHPLK